MADPHSNLRVPRNASDPRESGLAPHAPLRARRPEPDLRAARAALIEEAERIMGVKPILGPTGMRPTGY